MWRSVPQMDAAATSTSTSPGPGVGTGTSTSSRPGPGAGFRSARMLAGTVTAEGYSPSARPAHTSDAALRGLQPGRGPAAVGVVDRGPGRDDLVDRVERGLVQAEVGAGERLVELFHRLRPDDDRGHG